MFKKPEQIDILRDKDGLYKVYLNPIDGLPVNLKKAHKGLLEASQPLTHTNLNNLINDLVKRKFGGAKINMIDKFEQASNAKVVEPIPDARVMLEANKYKKDSSKSLKTSDLDKVNATVDAVELNSDVASEGALSNVKASANESPQGEAHDDVATPPVLAQHIQGTSDVDSVKVDKSQEDNNLKLNIKNYILENYVMKIIKAKGKTQKNEWTNMLKGFVKGVDYVYPNMKGYLEEVIKDYL